LIGLRRQFMGIIIFKLGDNQFDLVLNALNAG